MISYRWKTAGCLYVLMIIIKMVLVLLSLNLLYVCILTIIYMKYKNKNEMRYFMKSLKYNEKNDTLLFWIMCLNRKYRRYINIDKLHNLWHHM
jgi:hypothetical protein